MPITYNNGCFKLDTQNTSYSFKVGPFGFLMHEYYGPTVSDLDLGYVYTGNERSYMAVPYEDKNAVCRPDELMLEYSAFGISDFRTTALRVKQGDGSRVADLRYFSHEISSGVAVPENLPHARQNSTKNAQTLKIVLKDTATNLFVNIFYTVFPDLDVITRFCEIVNSNSLPVAVEKAASLQLDMPDTGYDFVRLLGAWAKERHIVRTAVSEGTQGFASRRGTSSHQANPFFCICRKNADEFSGNVYGFHLVYSGNHKTELETSQYGGLRLLMGINDEGFSYVLNPDEKFTSPQALLSFSANGFSGVSHNFHHFIRENIFDARWQGVRRPLLINNWEATYCNFNEDILVDLAKTAADLGIEMLVMDDGWFGHREDDKSSLGDWVPYKKRLKNGLKPLAERINAVGMKFGLWMEPEMISEDSDLYKAHPDWVLSVPGRDKTLGRNQFILDIVNNTVKEHVLNTLISVLESANIEYLKWDMNRYLTEVYSATLGVENQGEAYHRFVLALYDILERLTAHFPNLLIEHCSGGGGRFDTGMLYYSPQIWTSDDTDPAERVEIQFGTSLGYPVTSMGSHLSASPNHQTGRVSDFDTRADVAFCGTFGYELDINKLTAEEQEKIKQQCAFYKENYNLINFGEFYRIAFVPGKYAAWCFTSADKTEMLLFHIQLEAGANDGDYLLPIPCADASLRYVDETTRTTYFGNTLKNAGIMVPFVPGERKTFYRYFKAL